METFMTWFALALCVGLLLYGIAGLQTGKVEAMSYAMFTKSNYTGKKAKWLSIAWIIFGGLGTIAFGGHLLGIKWLAPLYDVAKSIMDSN